MSLIIGKSDFSLDFQAVIVVGINNSSKIDEIIYDFKVTCLEKSELAARLFTPSIRQLICTLLYFFFSPKLSEPPLCF